MQYLPVRPTRADATPDGIEVAEVVRTVRRQWRAVIGFLALGVLGALAVLLFAPREFEGKATLLARAGGTETGGSILGRITSIGSLMSGGAFGGLPSPFESELQVLRSRAVAGRVVDSLQLQFSVRSPRGLPPSIFIASSELQGSFAPRKYQFERGADGNYVVKHEGQTYGFTPGEPGKLDIGTVTVHNMGQSARSFAVKVYDREEAIDRLSKRLEATKAGGEVAKIVYRGEDSVTAALVPNLVVAYYLDRRKTVDRGTNQRRLEYVTDQLESTGRDLAATERALRSYQESSGVMDADAVGKAWLEGAVALRESLTTVLVDEGSINNLLDRTTKGTLAPRQLAAYPAFMRGTSISALQGRLADLESQRLRLLERRTERDPEVQVLDQSIHSIEEQIVGLARSYSSSVTEQRIGLTRQLDSLQKRMLTLPAAAEHGGRLQRDVMRLSAIYTALQAQLVEAKLGAIGEGGEIRSIDQAMPPRKPAFPEPWLTMVIGTFGGLLAGFIAALFLGWFGRWFRDPLEIERATGIAVQRFESNAPLLISGTVPRSLLVVPLGAGALAGPVVQRLAHTATARALRTNVLDLSAVHNGNGAEPNPRAIERLEAEGDMVIVQLPALSAEVTVGALRDNRPVLLVAPPGPVDRAQLASALDMLRRLGAPCAGVVISDQPRRGIRA
jgi:tyrosine-protein kinase Etk/Wzc